MSLNVVMRAVPSVCNERRPVALTADHPYVSMETGTSFLADGLNLVERYTLGLLTRAKV